MEIVERYLDSVKNCLPARQAEDIIKELSENIYAQIEDREGELGRNLTEVEVEGILKQHGHPLVVASRYRQEHRSVAFGGQIISPALFPFYLRVLKFNLGLTGVILVVIFAALFAGGQPIGNSPQIFMYQMMIQFAIVTFIFWLMDKHFTRFPDRWDPRKPYGVRNLGLAVPEDGPRIPRAKSISQIVGLLVALVWLRLVRHLPFLILGPGAAFLSLSPFWNAVYLPVVAVILVGLINAGVTVIRPDWVRFYYTLRIATRLCGLVMCYFLLRAGNVVVADAGANAHAVRVAQIVNQTLFYTILIAAVVTVVMVIRDLRKLLTNTNRGALTTAGVSQKP